MRIFVFWSEHYAMRGTVDAVARALGGWGHEVVVFRRRFSLRERLFGPDRPGDCRSWRLRRRARREAQNRAVRRTADADRPDLVLSFVGVDDWLFPETVAHLRQAAAGPVAAVLVDGLADRRMAGGLPHYNPVYSFDPRDPPVLREQYGRDTGAWRHFYDPAVFFPDAGVAPDIDLCFVGHPFPARLRLLDRVAAWCAEAGRRLAVAGRFWKAGRIGDKGRFARRHPALARYVDNRLYAPAEAAMLYRRSIICLNMHGNPSHEGGVQEGINIRTFEILGAGGFQLVDRLRALEPCFSAGRELETYGDGDELIEKIAYYLDHPDKRRSIAARGHAAAREKWTVDRVMRGFLAGLAPDRGNAP